MWVFEFNLRKTRTSRKPDLTSEDKGKKIFIVAKQNEKGTKYKQLAWIERMQSRFQSICYTCHYRSAQCRYQGNNSRSQENIQTRWFEQKDDVMSERDAKNHINWWLNNYLKNIVRTYSSWFFIDLFIFKIIWLTRGTEITFL